MLKSSDVIAFPVYLTACAFGVTVTAFCVIVKFSDFVTVPPKPLFPFTLTVTV